MSGLDISTASPSRDATAARPLEAGARRRCTATVLSVAAALLGACLTLLRQTGLRSWSTAWAEDGGVFLTEAWAQGPAVVLTPYTGYLHLVPRLLAEVAVSPPGAVVAYRWQGPAPFVGLTVLVSLVLLATITATARGPRDLLVWWFPVLTIAVALAALPAPVVLRGQVAVDTLQWEAIIQSGGARYTAVPALLLLAALLWGLEALRHLLPDPLGPGIAVAGVAVLVAVAALSFPSRSDRSAGPLWDEGVRTRGAACAEPGTPQVRVPVAPILPDAEWGATVPCTALRR